MSKWRPSKLNCVYAIGDVHGKYKQLKLILNRILPLRKSDGGNDTLVMLGDYIDRHQDSNRVLDLLVKNKKKFGSNLILLKGNHEDLFFKAMFSNAPEPYLVWMHNGGAHTLAGYLKRANIDLDNPFLFPRKRIKDIVPEEHINLISNLEPCYEHENYIFAHADYDLTKSANEQDSNILMWGENMFNTFKSLKFLKKEIPWNKRIVLGHFWRGPILHDKFMMIDVTQDDAVMVIEMRSKEGFIAKQGNNRLVKL